MSSEFVTVMGSFVADFAFRTPRLPRWGETVLGGEFRLGPGGKGSNQAVAAARLGAKVSFISKLGRDTLGDLARHTYAQEKLTRATCLPPTSMRPAAPPSLWTRQPARMPSSWSLAHAFS
jgi:sugar/nucleoside kinase (ribokinase family)